MKILALDFETGKSLVSTFQMWKANIPHSAVIKQGGQILMGSYSWLDPLEGTYTEPENISILDTQGKKLDVWDDGGLALAFSELVSAADVVVAHNGDAFDLKVLNTAIIKNDLEPLPPIISIDTLKIARRNFRFNHNNLVAVAEVLNVGKKGKSEGAWWELLANPYTEQKVLRQVIEDMIPYCDMDVEVLAEVYFALRKHDPRHPSFNLVSNEKDACPTCGNHSLKTNDSWIHKAHTQQYARYRCDSCGSWSRGTKCIKGAGINYRSI